MAKKQKSKLRENIETIISAIIIALLIRIFIIEAYMIPTTSMVPTLIGGDRLLVNKFMYGVRIPIVGWKLPGFSDPDRGDIIVFHWPEYESKSWYIELFDLTTFGIFGLTNTGVGGDTKNFIKRLIGIPGDIFSYDDKTKTLVIREKGEFGHVKVPITYRNEFQNKVIEGKILEIETPEIQSKHNDGKLKNAPQSFSQADFEKKILLTLPKDDMRKELKQYYKLDPSQKKYFLDAKLQPGDYAEILNLLYQSKYDPRYYTFNEKKGIVGNRGENVLVEEIRVTSSKKKLEHAIQLKNNSRDYKIPFVYIPKKGDKLELRLVKIKNHRHVMFKINGELLDTLSMAEYEDLYDTYYKNRLTSIFPNELSVDNPVYQYEFEANYYMMMGDNRDNSSDSRDWGLVHEDFIIGTPLLIYYPFSRFGGVGES